jgi:predicted  nucleic acid-binding Zn-ribbon protein|tara:strand:+ start:270 stop:506 length:237 start_codon:yes stop_codon:yes gene_type:complete
MNIIKKINKLKKLSKKNDTLEFVRKSIEIDLEKISKKSKEYKSMFDRCRNLTIEIMKNQIEMHQIAIAHMRYQKKVSA